MDRRDSSAGAPTEHPIVIDSDHYDRPHGWWARLTARRRPHLVTSARVSPAQSRQKRQRQYMWIQGVRIPFLTLSAVSYLWWHSIPLSVVLFLISVPLPWIAVVVANGVGEPRDRRSPQIYKPALARAERNALEASSVRQLPGAAPPDLNETPGEGPPS